MKSFIFNDFCRLEGRTGVALELVEIEQANCLSLQAATNEYVSFQFAVQGVEKVSDIRLMYNFGGGLEAEVFYQWFHQVGDKLVPDLLVPWGQACNLDEVVSKHYQSDYAVFWVDIFVPKGTAAGTYTSTLDVELGGETVSHKIDVLVHGVELTDENLIIADMNSYADTVTKNFPHLEENARRFEDGSYFEAESWIYKVFHEHRGVFHHLPYGHGGNNIHTFAPELSGEGKNIYVSDWTVYDAHFGPYFDGSAFNGTKRGEIPVPFSYLPFNFNWPSSFEKWGTEGYRIENRRIFLDFIRHFEEKGWTKTVFEIFYNHKKRYRFYPFDGDETKHEPDEEIIYKYDEIFGDLLEQSHVQTLFRTDSSWSYGVHYNSDIAKIIRMWVVAGGVLTLYPESFDVMKNLGNHLWMYGGLPTLDESLLKLYEWPLRCLQNNIDGFLYWNTVGIGLDFLVCPEAGGSMALFYPGHPFGIEGVLPSVRLKYLRNAMQVVDMVKMYEGTWTFHKMRDEIDKLYGVQRKEWHDETPELMLNTPPSELSNAMIDASPRNAPSRNATADMPLMVKEQILKMAAGYTGASSPWV